MSEISGPGATAPEENHELLPLSDTAGDQSRSSVESHRSHSGRQQMIFAIPRKPLPSYAVVSKPNEDDVDPDSDILTVDRGFLTWKPVYLRTPVLCGFLFVFGVFIATLEIVLRESKANYGLTTSTQSFHYLWTYGPSASKVTLCFGPLSYLTRNSLHLHRSSMG